MLVTEWTLAEVRRAVGDLAAAEALLLRIVPALERDLGAEHPDVAQVILGLGKLHRARRDFAAARREDLRALTISEKLLGPRHPQVAHCLVELAGLDIADARAADALPLLTRALAIYSEYEGDQTGELDAHLELTRALIATGGDRARARREAEAARAGQSAIGSTPRVAELDAWLAAHTSL